MTHTPEDPIKVLWACIESLHGEFCSGEPIEECSYCKPQRDAFEALKRERDALDEELYQLKKHQEEKRIALVKRALEAAAKELADRASKRPTGPDEWGRTESPDFELIRVGFVSASGIVRALDPAKIVGE
jgi:hypothetical protein